MSQEILSPDADAKLTSKDGSSRKIVSPKDSTRSQDESPAGDATLNLREKDSKSSPGVSDAARDKDAIEEAPALANVQRKSRSACRARSRDPKKCQLHLREIIDKHETRNEELEQLEGDLRERLEMLECSMPAVMVWNILRTAQGASPAVVRSLMEKQFRGVRDACTNQVPSSPSRHYDCRVREIEAERKEALKRAEEARSLLTDKEAVVAEREKRLEEARQENRERKERIERLNRQAAELREATKNARGDEITGETGNEMRSKEQLMDHIGSLTSIGSQELDSVARLQELAESEVCMKRRINELEHREEIYMRTLQQAEELWSKVEGGDAVGIRELREQLDLKTAANQRLADRICQLEDELERLKKRLVGLTGKEYVDAKIGIDDAVADVEDRGVAATIKTSTSFASASPETVDVDTTVRPKMKDKESSFAPEYEDKAISVGKKSFDKESQAIVVKMEREVDGSFDLGVDAGVGESPVVKTEHSERKLDELGEDGIYDLYETDSGDERKTFRPPRVSSKDQVESSTGMENLQPEIVATSDTKVQATVEVAEQSVGGREPEDIAEIVREVEMPFKSDAERDTLDATTRDERYTGETQRDEDHREKRGFVKKEDDATPKVSGKDGEVVSEDGRGIIERVSKAIIDFVEHKIDEVKHGQHPAKDDPTIVEAGGRADDKKDHKIDTTDWNVVQHPLDERHLSADPKIISQVDQGFTKPRDRKVEDTTDENDRSRAEKKMDIQPTEVIDGQALVDQMPEAGPHLEKNLPQPKEKMVSEHPTAISQDRKPIVDGVKQEIGDLVDTPESDASKPAKKSSKDGREIADRTGLGVLEIAGDIDQPKVGEEGAKKRAGISGDDSEVIIEQPAGKVDAPKDLQKTDEKRVSKGWAMIDDKRSEAITAGPGRKIDETREEQQHESDEKNIDGISKIIDKSDGGIIAKVDRGVDETREEEQRESDGKGVGEPLKIIGETGDTIIVEDDRKVAETEKELQQKSDGKGVGTIPKITSRSSDAIIGKVGRKIGEKREEIKPPKPDVGTVDETRRMMDKDGDRRIVQRTESQVDETSGLGIDDRVGGAKIAGLEDSEIKMDPVEAKRKEGISREPRVQEPDEEIPESWKHWNWEDGCPPDVICNNAVDAASENDADDFTEGKVLVGVDAPTGEGLKDGKPPVETMDRTDEIVLTREELRNWYNIVNSMHHAVSRCIRCKSQVDATARLMEKMNNHLWMMAFADEKDPIADEETGKFVTPKLEVPTEIHGTDDVEASSLRNDEAANRDPNGDEGPAEGDEDAVTISIVRTTILLEAEEYIAASSDQRDKVVPEKDEDQVDLDGNEMALIAALAEGQLPQLLLEGADMDPEEFIIPSGAQEISASKRSDLKPEARMEKSIVKASDQQGADKSNISGPHLEPESKPQPPRSVDVCICPPPMCHPGSPRDPRAEGTQTSPRYPRTLDRIRLAKPAEPSPDVFTRRRPSIWPKRQKDKSTVTAASVDTQTEGRIRREKFTYQNSACPGAGPRKPQGDFHDRIPPRRPDETSPPPGYTGSDAVAPLFHPPATPSHRPSKMPPREKEIAVTTYTGRSLSPAESEVCCADCGRSMASEGRSAPIKGKDHRTAMKSQMSIMEKLRKIATPARSSRKKGEYTYSECRLVENSRSKAEEDSRGSNCEKKCCECPESARERSTAETSRPSRKKRKPEKKDQSVTAKIPKGKPRKVPKKTRGAEDPAAIKDRASSSSREDFASSRVISSLTKSTAGCTGSSVLERSDEASFTVGLRSHEDKTSGDQTPQCGCSDDASLLVPYTNYSSIFRANITKDGCNCDSSTESASKERNGCDCTETRE